MTQRLDNVSAPIHSAFNPVDVTCSCTKCDSNYCFAKRHDVGSCSCEDCSEPKTCLFYSKRINRTCCSDATNTAPVFSVTSGTGTRRCLWDATTNTNNPSKNTLELYKNMLEISRQKIDALKNAYMSGTYKHESYKHGDPQSRLETQHFDRQRPEPSNYTTELSKRVLETQMSAVEPLKKIYLSKTENTKYKPPQDFHTNILEKCWNTIEMPNNKFLSQKRSCDCDDCLTTETRMTKYLDAPAGYIFECPKPTNAPKTDAQETKSKEGLSKNKSETKANGLEPVTNNNLPGGSCKCDDTSKNKSDPTILRFCVNVIPNLSEIKKFSKDENKFKYELCNNILEIQKNIMETLDSMSKPKEKNCSCEVKPIKKPNPAGYIYEVPKNTQDQTKPNTIGKICNCKGGPNNTSRSQSDSTGYVFELNKYKDKSKLMNNLTKQETCNCVDDPKNTCPGQKSSPGYIFDLNKRDPMQNDSCYCDDGAKTKSRRLSDSPGYIFELNNYKKKTIPTYNTITTGNRNIFDCSNTILSLIQRDSPGFVFDLNKNNQWHKTSSYCDDCTQKTSQRYADSPGYIFELNNYKDKPLSTYNTIKTGDRNILDSSNTILSQIQPDSPGFVFDLNKNKNTLPHEPSSNCIDCAQNTSKRQSESPGYIYDLTKSFRHTQTGDSCSSCNTGTKNTSHRQSDSPGYIYDLNKNKQEPKLKNGLRNSFNEGDSCNCNSGTKKSCDRQSDSPGYIYDINKSFSKGDSCNCNSGTQKTSQKQSDSPGYIYDLNKSLSKGDSCNCNSGTKNTCGSQSDSPGYIYDLNKSTSSNGPKKTFNKEESCNCNSSTKDTCRKQPDSPGYIYDLNKSISKGDSCNCNSGTQKACRKQSDSPGYIYDLTKSISKGDSCNCNFGKQKTLRRQSDSPGYIFDLNKSISKGDSCNCNSGTQKTSQGQSDSPGYIYYLNKITSKADSCNCNPGSQKTTKKFSDSAGYIYDLNKSISKGDSCNCNSGSQKTSGRQSDSPGYIYDLNKSISKGDSCNCNSGTQKTSQSQSDSPGYIYDLSKSISKGGCCNCNSGTKDICQKQSDSPGYIYDLNKSLSKGDNCNCNYVTRKTSQRQSDSPGYIYNLNQSISKEDSCNCISDTKNTSQRKFDSPGYIYDLNKSFSKGDSCNCNYSSQKTSQRPSDSPGYIYDLNKSISKGDSCNCNSGTQKTSRRQSDSPGYIFDLNKLNSKGDSCNCNSGTKNTSQGKSDSPGYIYDLNKSINKGNSCNCNSGSQKTSQRPYDSPGYIYDLNKSISKEDSCNCNSDNQKSFRRQSDSPGYIFYLNKLISKGDSCNCNSVTKNTFQGKSDSPGYIYDLNKSISKGDSCNSNSDSKKTSQRYIIDLNKIKNSLQKYCNCNSKGYILRLDKYKKTLQDSANFREILVNRLETQNSPMETYNNTNLQIHRCECNGSKENDPESPGYVFDLPKYSDVHNPYKKKSCECSESYQKSSEPAGYIMELPIHAYEPSKNTQELCKTIIETQVNTLQTNIFNTSQNSIDDCSCDKPGQSFEQNTHIKVYNLHDSPEETSSCNCPDSQQHSEKFNDTNYRQNISRNQTGSKTISMEELKRIYLPKHSSKHMLETKGIEIEKLKEIYLPKKNKIDSRNTLDEPKNILEISKNTFDLCKAPTNKIEMLKNIYMPPRFTVDYTKKYEYPDTSDSRRNIDSTQTAAETCLPCRKELNSGTAMLSAEIMNMPYTKFNDSLGKKQLDGDNKASKLTKYDILSRIKEAYKACSCKVCECIVGKSVETTVCDCKPCECEECTAYLDHSNHLDEDVKCPCARCSKKQCEKASLEYNKQEICDCKPCDCIKCTKLSENLCDCEPCQCDECKQKTSRMPQMYVVAPVGASAQRVACSCSPCDCIECGQTYPLASSVMHEMSTGTNRHALCRCEVCLSDTCDQAGANACKCERRNRVMSKPVEKDSHDFDIRTAMVHYKSLHHSSKRRNKKHQTIAMFASLPDKYPSFPSTHKRLGNTKTCNCEECECISCICKEDAINAIKSSQLLSINKTKTTSKLNIRNKSKLNRHSSCECKPCECQICQKYIENKLFLNNRVLSTHEKSCLCVMCDCLDCNSEHRHHKYSINDTYERSLRECRDCKAKLIIDPHKIDDSRCSICIYERCFGDEMSRNKILHRIKKGEVLTPSNHQIKVKSMILEKRHLRVPSSIIRKVSSNKDNTRKLTKCNYRDLFNFDIRHKSEVLKGDTYIQFQERYKGKPSHDDNSINHEISGRYISGYSSFETSPKTSSHKGCGSITPMSRKKNKSWESSCNSSGHDYPEYLIQFPKSTVEACLKDVIELDIDKTIKIDGINIIPNSNSTDNENLYQSHECKIIDSRDSKFLSIYRTGSLKQHNRKNHSNQRTYKFKSNEETNDSEIKDRNQLKATEFIKSSMSSIRSHSEYSNYVNVKLNEFHSTRKVFDYNVAEENINNLFPIPNEKYCTWKYSKQLPHPYFNGIDILNIDEDNKRVQKTLKEAKEFSLELTRLLEMYEKANKEFESISKKLMKSHGSLFSGDFDVTKESSSIEEDVVEKCFVEEKRFSQIEHELQEIHLEAPSVREKLTSTSILQNKGKTSEITIMNGGNVNNLNLQKLSAYKDILNNQKVREPIAEYDPSSKMNSVFHNNLLEKIETHLKNNEVCFESLANERAIGNREDIFKNDERTMKSCFKPEEEANSYDKSEEIVTSPDNGGMKRKGQINNKNYKKYSKLLKRTIIISKRISVKHSNRNESNPVVKYYVTVGTSTTFVSEINTKTNNERDTLLPVKLSVKDTEEENGTQKHRKHELNHIAKKLDTIFGNTEDVSICTSTDTYGLDKDLEQYELEDTGIDAKNGVKKLLEMPVLEKKYAYHRPQSYFTKESLNKNNLEWKISPQLSLHKIHKDVKNVDHEVLCSHTRESLEDQMRSLLDLSVLLPLIEKDKELDDNVETTTLIPSIGGAKSSREALKVGFLCVRRVSDHTVLVKWNVPQVLTKVKGYELLVDGRAVQKIFSPSKCMAVVTCLPHTDKVLLTIRTIISGVSMTGHYPATTIIYRPRVK